MTPPRILVIDDQYGRWDAHRQSFLAAVGITEGLSCSTYAVEFCAGQDSGKNSLAVVEQAVRSRWPSPDDHNSSERWSLLLLDVHFEEEALGNSADEFGFVILQYLRDVFGRTLPIVMLTRENDTVTRSLANSGLADGFLSKTALSPLALADRLSEHGLYPDLRPTNRLLGTSLRLLEVLRAARRVARREGDGCLVLGETGSGKTELGKFIHDHSGRGGPFRLWTAEGLREDLMKDALFGHWKGAHSEAALPVAGVIEQAHRGTFFLDEIANLTPALQQLFLQLRRRDSENFRRLSRLGRFPAAPSDVRIAEKSVLGVLESDGTVKVDLLLLAATNERIFSDRADSAGFRLDLLNAFSRKITFPSLNERREDIPVLFASFVGRARGARPFALSPAVLAALMDHDWADGNIVSLKQVAEAAAHAIEDFDEVLPHHVPDLFDAGRSPRQIGTVAASQPSKTPRQNLSALLQSLDDFAPEPLSDDLRGSLPKLHLAYVRLLLRLFGAALRTSRTRSGATSTLAALSQLLDASKLTRNGVSETKKSFDILKRLLLLADVAFEHRSAASCLLIENDDTLLATSVDSSTTELSSDAVVVQHVRQAIQQRDKPNDKQD